MPMDLSKYERRLNAKSIGEGLINETIDMINSSFYDNPSYKTCIHNNEEVDCLFKLNNKQSNILYLTFRPLYFVNKGDYIEFESNVYFVKDFIKNEIYPKAEILLCNNVLKWKNEYDDVFQFPCSISGNTFTLEDSVTSSNKFVLKADSTMYVKVPYNDYTKTIYPTQRFIINNRVYDVTSINDIEVLDSKGYLELGLSITAKSESDNFVENIANENKNTGWGEW